MTNFSVVALPQHRRHDRFLIVIPDEANSLFAANAWLNLSLYPFRDFRVHRFICQQQLFQVAPMIRAVTHVALSEANDFKIFFYSHVSPQFLIMNGFAYQELTHPLFTNLPL